MHIFQKLGREVVMEVHFFCNRLEMFIKLRDVNLNVGSIT